MKTFTFATIKNDLRNAFLLSVTICLGVFAILKLVFLDIPFSRNEWMGLVQNIATYWVIFFGFKMLLNLVVVAGKSINKSLMMK